MTIDDIVKEFDKKVYIEEPLLDLTSKQNIAFQKHRTKAAYLHDLLRSTLTTFLEEKAREIEAMRGTYPPNTLGQYLHKSQITALLRKEINHHPMDPIKTKIIEAISDEEIRHIVNRMVDRFLQWKLPADFNPDGGIHFDADAAKKLNPNNHKYEPVGTNLLTAAQARELFFYLLEDYRPITLADVLRAMPFYTPGEPIVGVDHEGTFLEWRDGAFHYFDDIPQWNLAVDWDGQTDELKAFVGKLLGVQ